MWGDKRGHMTTLYCLRRMGVELPKDITRHYFSASWCLENLSFSEVVSIFEHIEQKLVRCSPRGKRLTVELLHEMKSQCANRKLP
jgi:hypothetical protein